MEKILEERLSQIGIVPVVKIADKEQAAPLAKALCDGGLPCAEVTFRTEAAADSMRIMKETCPNMLIGAGTVLTVEQAERAVEAGAEFVVSPGLGEEVVQYCVDRNIPIIPGCANASDIERAMKYGLTMVKFFPAEAAGGVEYLKALSAPYRQMRFMPTGGIDETNMKQYLELECVTACGGTWMVKQELLDAGDFNIIRELTEKAVCVMHGFRLAHVGINCNTLEAARKVADAFEALFAFHPDENPNSIFSSGYVETMKTPFLGEHGHIAIGTDSVERGKAFLERKGIVFMEDSAVYRKDGRLQAVYMMEDIGGFAVHLVRNSK